MAKTLLTTWISPSTPVHGIVSEIGRTHLAVEISDYLPEILRVPDDCFLAAVVLADNGVEQYGVHLPDGSERLVSASKHSVWLLPPKTQLMQLGQRIEKVVLYFIPESSVSAFAEYSGMKDRSSLVAPQMTSDPFLKLLSKAAVPLLSPGTRKLAGSSVVRYFLSSLLSHLVSNYGTFAQLESRQHVGGLAPRHKALVQSLLSSPDNVLLSTEDLAAQCGLSPTHFARAFRQSFGMTAHRYLISLRLHHAKQYLADGVLSLEEISRKAGYSDQATFTVTFKRFTGTPPGKFRRRYAKSSSEGQSELALPNDVSIRAGTVVPV